MITTDDEKLANKLRRLRDHGAQMSDLQRHLGPKPYLLADHPDAGYNQRMTDLQAALGSAQMQRAESIVAERRQLAATYDTAFASLDWLETSVVPAGYGHGYQSYPCLFEPELVRQALGNGDQQLINEVHERRNAWMEALQQEGVSTRPATHAVHMLSYYLRKYQLIPEQFPAAQAANECSISLPLFHGMQPEEQKHVIDVVGSRKI
jgi:dTDP-4-amino-4,6-dideoxygalactose transaminase